MNLLTDPTPQELRQGAPQEELERDLLVQCYLSGQISEECWQKHIAADPALAAHLAGKTQ